MSPLVEFVLLLAILVAGLFATVLVTLLGYVAASFAIALIVGTGFALIAAVIGIVLRPRNKRDGVPHGS